MTVPTRARRGLGRILAVLLAGIASGLLCVPGQAHAQPSADQALTDMGLSASDKQRVLRGEFVTADLAGVSERDLAFAIAFLVNKSTPESVSKQIVAGDLVSADAQVQAYGAISGSGSLADLAGLKITTEEGKALSSARAGDAVNFSAGEIVALKAAAGDTPEAVQQALRQVLLARYQAYRTAGLAGAAPYDRGGGRTAEVASDLRRASEAAKGLGKYLPAFQKVLLGYPKAAAPELRESFFWVRSIIEDKPTYVLTHILSASDGEARVLARRQFYVSTGYNAEQSVAGFLPVKGGTVAVVTSHAFTDQVTGLGGSMKRSIGSRIMASKMKEIFDAGRKKFGR